MARVWPGLTLAGGAVQAVRAAGRGHHRDEGYAGGRLFDARTSPFGVALTPVQCLHYALTRPAVASVLVATTLPPMWTPPWPMRPPPRRSGTTPACWPRHPAMPTPASAPIAATAPLPGGHRHRHGQQALRPGRHAAGGARHGAGPLPGPFPPRQRTALPVAAAKPAVPLGCPWWSAWKRPRRCLGEPSPRIAGESGAY